MDTNAVWPIGYLFCKTSYVFILNPFQKMWLSDSVSSVLLIIRAVSNSIIHTQKPHAVFSCLLPLLTLRPKAGRVRKRRWEKVSPAVRQICLFTLQKAKNNDIFFLVGDCCKSLHQTIDVLISWHYGNTGSAVYMPDFTLGVYCYCAIFILS